MALSTANRKEIDSFFNDKTLSDTFVNLYNYQVSICNDVVFVNRGTIIGFGRPGEHLRCYVTKASSGFLLKVKTCNEAQEFRKEDFKDYKDLIQWNTINFIISPEKYTLAEKSQSNKRSQKKTSKSKEKSDPVLAKLKNRNHARKFTLQDFNELDDWSYCTSFNEKAYVYTLPNGNKIECDSRSEVKLLNYLTENKIVKAIGGQNLLIKYDSAFRTGLDYYPDLVILTKDNHIAIIEVKPVKAMSYHKNIEKYGALKDYCEDRGYEYMMIDPDHDYMTFDDMMKLHVPSAINERIDAYLINLIGQRKARLLEPEDVAILYDDFSEEYKKGDFELYLHSLVIQREWYNCYKNGFMVYEKTYKY